jgi:hypothetical protein
LLLFMQRVSVSPTQNNKVESSTQYTLASPSNSL